MSEFLAMGGYGAYVWTAYGVTALCLLLLFVWSWFGARAREAEFEQIRKLSRAERREPSTATASVGVLGGGSMAAVSTDSQVMDSGAAPISTGDAGSGVS